MKKHKGRRVPPVQPGERRQHQPGELIGLLHPITRQNIEALARAGFERDGRGLLGVWINDALDTGIEGAQYYGIMKMADLQRRIPFGDAQPLAEAARRYDPAREFVAVILNVTRTLPGPQLWWEVFPYTGKAMP